ncbi:hypothetical protein P167DRAFT_533360, partial [Morchella conica CCBAS932]
YGNIADYVQFRRMVWASQRGDANMPKVSTWFRNLDGSAGGRRRSSHAPDSDDDDSDIEIAQERQSYQCPLTLRTFVEPYTSTVCPHSFEKDAIQDYICKGSRQGRKVRGAAARARDRAEEHEDGEEDSEDGDMVDADADEGVAVKNERRGAMRRRGRGKVVALSDEEDED